MRSVVNVIGMSRARMYTRQTGGNSYGRETVFSDTCPASACRLGCFRSPGPDSRLIVDVASPSTLMEWQGRDGTQERMAELLRPQSLEACPVSLFQHEPLVSFRHRIVAIAQLYGSEWFCRLAEEL